MAILEMLFGWVDGRERYVVCRWGGVVWRKKAVVWLNRIGGIDGGVGNVCLVS